MSPEKTEPQGIFKSVGGSKKNGSEGRKRRAICRAIISGEPLREGRYTEEMKNLRLLASECTDCEYPDTFYTEGKAIDTLFDFAYVEGMLTPREMCEFIGAWNYLKEKWGM